MTGNCHVRFGNGGGAGDRSADRNLGKLLWIDNVLLAFELGLATKGRIVLRLGVLYSADRKL